MLVRGSQYKKYKNYLLSIGEKMKYIIKKFNADFILDEIEQFRSQFVSSLTYSIESAKVIFDDKAYDPLDIYIEYDFQHKDGDKVIYGFNLKEEVAKNFGLDADKQHTSKQLLNISKHLKELADEIDNRYQPLSSKALAEAKDKQDSEYAKGINRSYRQVLKEAIAKDQAIRNDPQLEDKANKEFLNAEHNLNTQLDHTPSLKENVKD